MNVRIVCFGIMREYLPDPSRNETSVEIPAGATVGDVIDALGAPRRLVHALLVNENRSDFDEKVAEGDEITLMPSFSGG
jgi:molybdopterin converting factor small subunit